MEGSELDIGILGEIPDHEREAAAAVFRVEHVPVGTVLVLEGDMPTKLFVLLDGHVTVHRGGDHVADLGPGDVCGELGVLGLERRNATVIATTPVRSAVAMGWDVRGLLDGCPELHAALERAGAGHRPPG